MTGPVDAWLRDLDVRLTAWGSQRRGVLTELEDGLRCAAEAHRRESLPPREAEAAAVAEFGDPAEVTQLLAPELTASLSHATAVRLLGSGPALGALWLLALTVSTPSPAGFSPLLPRLATQVLAAVPLLPAAIAATGAAAGLTVITTAARGDVRFRLASAAAAVTGAAVVAGDLVLLSALTARIGQVRAPALLLLGVAGLASIVRIGISLRSVHRCLSARTHLA